MSPNGRDALTIERYGRRFWALYESGTLLCVTVYRKGAAAVKARIETNVPLPATMLQSERAAPRSIRRRR